MRKNSLNQEDAKVFKSKEFWSNCWLWSIRQLYRRGGWIAFRKGRICKGFIPHVGWITPDSKRLYHFRPSNRGGLKVNPFGVLYHKGYIRSGEDNL